MVYSIINYPEILIAKFSYIDDITWVKQTVNRRMAKGHGYYLQHAKETCLVGKKVMVMLCL